jgi:hypothetical protein
VLLLSGSKEPPRAETWHGRTAQGRSVTVYVVDGRPRGFRTSAIVTCPANRYVQWLPDTASRAQDGTLTVSDTWTKDYGDGRIGHGTSTLRARAGDEVADGTIRMVQRIAGDGQRYVCDSGTVTFSARAG